VIKTANFVELSEEEFAEFVKDIEEDPLFKKLTCPEDKLRRAVRYKRFPFTDLAPHFCEFDENIACGRGIEGLDSFFADNKKVIRLIKHLGEDRFKNLFLLDEESLSPDEIASRCGLTLDDVKEITGFLKRIDVYGEFESYAGRGADFKKRFSKVAAIGIREGGGFVIQFFSVKAARGKYLIDYAKIEKLKRENFFSDAEKRNLGKIIRNMELINSRKTMIYRIIEKITRKQNVYLKSGDTKDIIPFSQKELAESIDADCSMVCRAVVGRSVESPLGIEIPLIDFFPSRKDIVKLRISDILSEEKPYTDEAIRKELKERFNIVISRRSVASCRKEMSLPSSFERMKGKVNKFG